MIVMHNNRIIDFNQHTANANAPSVKAMRSVLLNEVF
jgi:hypothetical protein